MQYKIAQKSCMAAILVQNRKPLAIDEIELPERLEYGQVLVKLLYSGICGSQIGEIDGRKGEDKYLPHLLGHEGSAIAIQCGPGVSTVQADDLVVLHWRKGEGINSAPPVYKWQNKKLNAGWVTTFNEYAVVSENRITPVSKSYNPEYLPLMGCAVTTAFGAVNNDACIKLGESTVILGTGGVGLAMAAGASLAGSYPVIAVDIYANRLELAKTLGATHIVQSSGENALAAVKKILAENGQPDGADVCFENTGKSKCISAACNIVHPQGRIVCVGVPDKDDLAALATLPFHFGKKLTGSHGGNSNPAADIPNYLRLLKARKFNTGAMISKNYPLSEINEAMDEMRKGTVAGRCMIDFGLK